MSIPARFQIKPPSVELVQQLCELCDSIEHTLELREDAEPLLAQWHEHAMRRYEPYEFTSYASAIDQESFVLGALYPEPANVEDLQFQEAAAVLESVMRVQLSESETSYYLKWLEAQFPNSMFSDLIYWPDEWFGDATLFRDASGAFKEDADLSPNQILAYAMLRSGRKLPGTPEDITLPFPMPEPQ